MRTFRSVIATLCLLAGMSLATATAAANEPREPICHCRIVRSDCGACTDRCVVKDLGAIGQFRICRPTRTDGLCKDEPTPISWIV